MYRFILCDNDDKFCRKEKKFISEFYKKLDIGVKIDIYHSGEEIISLGEKISAYHAIFLDVNMESVSGIDLGNWLSNAVPDLIIVFVSGSMSHAIDGYRVGAVRYLMKDERLFEHSMEECLNFILWKSREDDSNYISIADEKIRFSVNKVLYVESKAHKITYYLMKNSATQQEYTVYGKLSEAEEELKRHGFCRVHQSYLVNMNYVREVQRYTATLFDGTQIQISKKNYKAAEEQFVRIRGTF